MTLRSLFSHLTPIILFALITSITLFTLLTPSFSYAYNPDYLISDWDLTDPFALDFNQIQHFLNRGYLGDYKTENWEGDSKYAVSIIWDAAQYIGISPKVLLVMLQKEQSLIEDDNPSENQLNWAMGYGVCDSCSKSDPSIQRWLGFGKQVNSTALQLIDGYLADIEEDGSTQGKYGPGIPVEIDGTTVTPANAATAALYAYTPHLHGNENFVTIWNRWFETEYPSGSLLKVAGQNGVYLIEYGYKRPIHSWSALLSRFNPDLIIEVSENTLANYADGQAINFPNYSLLQDESGQIYLLVDDSLRPFASTDVFHAIGFADDELVQITSDDVSAFEIGDTVTNSTQDPTGKLLRLTTNNALFYVRDGYRHIILDDIIAKLAYPNLQAVSALPVEVEQYKEAEPIKIPDGYLVKSADTPTVYVVSEGEIRAIASEQVFTSFGWSWDDILTVSQTALNLHRIGDSINTEF